MKKKSKIITATITSIIAAVLCAAIVITVITHRDWFVASSSTNSDTSSAIETIIIEQTVSDETTASETEPEPQGNSSQQPTSKPTTTSTPTSSSQNQTSSTSSSSGKKFVHEANLETGISWDGESPILFIYPDGSTGYEKREGARYEAYPGLWTEVYVWRDDFGREYGTFCSQCGQEVGNGCYHDDEARYCSHCGVLVPQQTCHDCDGKGVKYCNDCGKLYGDGTNGTCISHWTGGDWVHELCGATIPVDTCHTCGVPVVIEPLPGTTVNSPDQLTAAHKETLYNRAARIVEDNIDARDNPKLIAVYSFVLTDNTALSTRSKCVCFYVYSVKYTGRDEVVYHAGEMFDLYINEWDYIMSTSTRGSIWYTSEADAVADYQKVGTNISKIG